jgi:hypothetical protein
MTATKSVIRLVFPVVALAFAPAAWAEDRQPPASEYVEGLRACQAIVEPGARLACYDAAAGRMVAAAEQGEVRVVDREDVERTRRRLFGFSLPDIGIFGGGKESGEDDELDMLESTITSARRVGDDWVFTIEEGDAVWQISNPPMRLARLKPGDKVVFKKAALGSYFIRIDGQIGVKGTRIR